MGLPHRTVPDPASTLNFEKLQEEVKTAVTGPTGPTGPEGDPGIIISATPPDNTDSLWADTTETGDVGIGPTGPSGPSGPTGPIAPTGAIVAWPTNTAPTGWVLCIGVAVNSGGGLSKTTYADLYAVIGGTYGEAGDYFYPPDMRARTIVGRNPGDADFGNLDDKPGNRTHTLATTEIPSHTHTYQGTTVTNTSTAGSGNRVGELGSGPSQTSGAAGGGGPHNNIQPSVVLNYIIKT